MIYYIYYIFCLQVKERCMPKDFVPKKLTQRAQRYKEHKEGAGSNSDWLHFS